MTSRRKSPLRIRITYEDWDRIGDLADMLGSEIVELAKRSPKLRAHGEVTQELISGNPVLAALWEARQRIYDAWHQAGLEVEKER